VPSTSARSFWEYEKSSMPPSGVREEVDGRSALPNGVRKLSFVSQKCQGAKVRSYLRLA
jgi:hypothetical protein